MRPRPILAFMIGGALAVGACGGSSDGACPSNLRFEGVMYYGVASGGDELQLAEPLGQGINPGCAESPGEDVADEPLTVVAVEGIDPAVAVARSDHRFAIYVVPGRCSGYLGWAAYFECLKTRLLFDGVYYTAIKLLPSDNSVGPLRTKEEVGVGELRVAGEPAGERTVVRIEGIDRERAVAAAGDPSTLFVADGACYEFETSDVLECLRGAS